MRRLQLVDSAPVDAEASDDAPCLRVAIATQDMKSSNAHFGSARKFAIYDVGPAQSRFVAAVEFAGEVSDESGSHAKDGEDRIGPKVDALRGCNLLFCLAIGGPSAVKVVNARIHPIKLSKPESIDSILERVRTMLSGSPPPWLRKAMGAGQPRSMDHLDEED